ncbi:MAG: cytochrome b/b6 domain-containing protein [Zetaproteobacteria bacterium]|nr:cytochrome b/b6 domain-containing protein [Zetaproteobacteria bacterium]
MYTRTSRILHWMFSYAIIFQLISESLMKRPKPGRVRDEQQIFFFEAHEYVGLLVLLLITLRLLYVMKKNQWLELYPWISSAGVSAVLQEVKQVPGWFAGKLAMNLDSPLAKTVHGLGLLLALALGITGCTMYLGMDADGTMRGVVHSAKELHEGLGSLLWIYIIGHVGMVIFHQLKGHQVLQRIYSLRPDK